MKTEAGRLDDKYFLEGLKRSDTKVFEALFDLYYANLVMFCGNYLRIFTSVRTLSRESL